MYERLTQLQKKNSEIQLSQHRVLQMFGDSDEVSVPLIRTLFTCEQQFILENFLIT